MAGLDGSVFAHAQATVADSRMPDGTEHVFWDKPVNFSKTYYVDNGSAKADDNGPGSKDKPFRTISKAAQVLQPGERVLIASGTYRECVRPERGGTSAEKMISYEAAPGAKVYIKGSDVLKDKWVQDPVFSFGRPPSPNGGPAAPPPPMPPTWGYKFTGAMFPDAYNPFALASVAGDRAWLDTKVSDMGNYFRRRGLVFADGKPLEQVEVQRELTAPTLFTPPAPGAPPTMSGLPPRARGGPLMQEVGGAQNARFWPDANGQSVHVRLPDGAPADHVIEATTREQVFAPLTRGLEYIRVKGLNILHAGNGFPLPQRGAMLDVVGGNFWIIEDNTFEWANGIGVEVGGGGGPQPPQGHIVRRNTFRYCGIEGIAGIGSRDVLLEDNLFEWCGWADAEREWESAAVKFHRAQNMLMRRNVIRHTRHGNAVWFDSGNVNCRITSNIFADTLSVASAVHMEVNLQQNQIDNNVIWDVRNAEPGTPGQRGCAGSGIFINATDKTIIAQNLIGRCDNSGIYAIVRPDRANTGLFKETRIYNNIFTQCDRSAIVMLNKNNESDGNLFADGLPFHFLGFFTGDSKQFLSLADWRAAYGWDKTSATANVQIDFDCDRLELTISSKQPFPRVSAFHNIETDLFGKGTEGRRVAGPLADPGAKSVWKVDPRVGVS